MSSTRKSAAPGSTGGSTRFEATGYEATELPPGNTSAALCHPGTGCGRVFASELAFVVHREGCRYGNDHWKTNLALLDNGLWATHDDRDRYEHMAKMNAAKKGE